MLDRDFPFYALGFLIAAGMTVLILRRLIPYLARRAQQPIYAEGPSWHRAKAGTPTLGGLSFLLAGGTVFLLSALFLMLRGMREEALSLLLAGGYAICNGAVGIADDLTKLRHHHNEGLTPRQKLLFQFLLSALYLAARHFLLFDRTVIYFSFGEVDLGIFYYPLTLLILMGITNCANLTDGIDGLSSSVAFGVGVSLFYISAALSDTVSFLSAAMVGISLGFLVFNLHPARIFMGDTGSLFFGALAASCAVTLGNPLLIVGIGGIYVLEGISVILQVAVYKLTHKRLFRMAPIHHHFEKLGWSENRICLVAILLTLLFSIPAYILYLP